MNKKIREGFLLSCGVAVISSSFIPLGFIAYHSYNIPHIIEKHEKLKQETWKTYSLEEIAKNKGSIINEAEEISQSLRKIEESPEYIVENERFNSIEKRLYTITLKYLAFGVSISALAFYISRRRS